MLEEMVGKRITINVATGFSIVGDFYNGILKK